jgi:hypothetical protein
MCSKSGAVGETISWVDKVTDEDIFRRTGEKRSFCKNLATYYDTKKSKNNNHRKGRGKAKAYMRA